MTVTKYPTEVQPHSAAGRVLLFGASRGLGLALAEKWVEGGWHVTATVRETGKTALHELAERHRPQVEIESLDVTSPFQIAAMHGRFAGRKSTFSFTTPVQRTSRTGRSQRPRPTSSSR